MDIVNKMVVCVCCNINEDNINKALDNGILPEAVHEYFECDIICECCLSTIEEMAIYKKKQIILEPPS
jgi:bacterioferritin-associated ferredoxin